MVPNALNEMALASILSKEEDDDVVKFVYNLIHAKKMTIYKADWNDGFQSVTAFANKDRVYGEIYLRGGTSFRWRDVYPLD